MLKYYIPPLKSLPTIIVDAQNSPLYYYLLFLFFVLLILISYSNMLSFEYLGRSFLSFLKSMHQNLKFDSIVLLLIK